MKVVEVVWDDAWVDTSEITVKKAKTIKPIRTISVGFLVAENEHGIVMATDTYKGDKKNARVYNHIPWGMVVSYTEYVDA